MAQIVQCGKIPKNVLLLRKSNLDDLTSVKHYNVRYMKRLSGLYDMDHKTGMIQKSPLKLSLLKQTKWG